MAFKLESNCHAQELIPLSKVRVVYGRSATQAYRAIAVLFVNLRHFFLC